MGVLRDNPVLVRELRVRMRGAKAYWLMLTYVLIATAIVVSVGVWFAGAQNRPWGRPPQGHDLGKALAIWVMVGQGIMVCLLAPGLSSSVISSERERQTYGLLRITLLRAFQIVAGKLLSSLSYLGLLVLSAAPFVALAFLYGGVSWLQIGRAGVTLVAAGVYFASAGLWWSAMGRRTATSTVGAYGTMLLFAVGGLAAAGLVEMTRSWQGLGHSPAFEELMAFLLTLCPPIDSAFAIDGPSHMGWGICRDYPITGIVYAVLAVVTVLLATLAVRQRVE